MKQMAYLAWWYVQNVVLKKKHPLQTVLFVTDHCNLRCKHCSESGHAGTMMKPYEQIREELLYSFELGSRFVDFEGGEPTLWRDGGYRLNDLYKLAKQIGFFSGTLTTNGQQPFGDTLADSVWVSVDGYKKVHDDIRGAGAFEKLDSNIRSSGRTDISINMAVNRKNRHSVSDVIRYAGENAAIRQVSLNFHTPYPGTEHMAVPWEERCEIVDQILEMKRQGYPVMNSTSGLKMMKIKDYDKTCWVSNFILTDGTRLAECPGKTLDLCRECGFGMSGEMYSVIHLKPDTILSALKLRM